MAVFGMTGIGGPAHAQNVYTLNLSNQVSTDMVSLRGFDPALFTGPSDPRPDTSNPFPGSGVGECFSSQFGCGVPAGSSAAEIIQNCDTGGGLPATAITTCSPLTVQRVTELADAFQTMENGLLSRLSTETAACDAIGPSDPFRRCTEIVYGFSQNVVERGQVFEMNFSVQALTDASGNAIGSVGTYTQTLMEDGVTSTCGGTFSFNGDLTDANNDARPDGLTVVGPVHQC